MFTEGAEMSATESTRALVLRWIEAFNNHDLAAFRDLFAEDYEEVGPSGTLSGREAALADAVETFTSQPDCEILVTALVADANFAAVEYQMQGTMAAPEHLPNGRVVPGTGRRYDMPGCSFISVEGTKIISVHNYYDRALMREQLGLPAEGAPLDSN